MSTERPTLEAFLQTALERYEQEYPQEMKLLRIGGVHPLEQQPWTNPYTHEPDPEYFGNIGEHCLAVALCGQTIVSELPVSDDQKTQIVRRALVHDANKRFELMRKKARQAGIDVDAYSLSAYATVELLLRQAGTPEETIAYMASAGRETGHNSLPQFVAIQDDEPVLVTDGNLAEMIVHLADDMTSTTITQGQPAQTRYLTIEERMRASDFPNRYPFLYQEGFGFDPQGQAVRMLDVTNPPSETTHVHTYADWQVWVANEIAHHLAAQIDPTISREQAGQTLVNLVNQHLPA